MPINTSVSGDYNSRVQSYYHYVYTTESFSGVNLVKEQSAVGGRSAWIVNGTQWSPVNQVSVLKNGVWKSTGPSAERIKTVRTTRYRWTASHNAGDVGNGSVITFTVPGNYYIPAGFKLMSYQTYGAYDDVCDGNWFQGDGDFDDDIVSTRALIMSRRSCYTYVGRAGGIQWSTWNDTQEGLACGQSSNIACVDIRTADRAPQPSGCDRIERRVIRPDLIAPFDIRYWRDYKAGRDCNTCNHAVWVFHNDWEDPNSTVISYDPPLES